MGISAERREWLYWVKRLPAEQYWPIYIAEAQALFEKYVRRYGPEDCWGWKDYPINMGSYPNAGMICGTATIGAHELAVFVERRQSPMWGHYICHRCDRKGCVNPKHLFIGSNHDNVRDLVSKGLRRSLRFTPEQVAKYRALPYSVETIKLVAAETGTDTGTVRSMLRCESYRPFTSEGM